MNKRLRTLADNLFRFSHREGRRILLLIPLLVLLASLFLWQGKPQFDRNLTQYYTRLSDSLAQVPTPENPSGTDDSLFRFDPNTVSQRELEQLGFSPKQASSILRYRTAGTTFRKPADFARCYAVSQKKFQQLLPYIVIATPPLPENKPLNHDQPTNSTQPGCDSLFVFDPNTVSQAELEQLGFSPKQAAAILRYRTAGAVFRKPADFARCYTVSEEKFQKLEPYIRIHPSETTQPVPESPERPELNSMDSTALVTLRGVGPLTAGRIVRYRQRLGGFVRVEQLQEIEGMNEKNYHLILQQIWVDSSKIQKIDINFALPLQLGNHPYLPERVLNRLLKYRQLKGGWRSIGDLTEQHIFSEEQAAKLSPYLCFSVE